MPMRQVLERTGRVGVVVVVTRYYGGTKLGTGGLVRAYSGACQAVVDVAEWEEVREGSRVHVSGIPAAQVSALYRLADVDTGAGAGVELSEVEFGVDGFASAELWVVNEQIPTLRTRLEALDRDHVRVTVGLEG